jgi:hypothetical protein
MTKHRAVKNVAGLNLQHGWLNHQRYGQRMMILHMPSLSVQRCSHTFDGSFKTVPWEVPPSFFSSKPSERRRSLTTTESIRSLQVVHLRMRHSRQFEDRLLPHEQCHGTSLVSPECQPSLARRNGGLHTSPCMKPADVHALHRSLYLRFTAVHIHLRSTQVTLQNSTTRDSQSCLRESLFVGTVRNLLHSQCSHPNSHVHVATWLFGWLHWLRCRFLTGPTLFHALSCSTRVYQALKHTSSVILRT